MALLHPYGAAVKNNAYCRFLKSDELRTVCIVLFLPEPLVPLFADARFMYTAFFWHYI